MNKYTDNEKLQAMAEELAKDLHSEEDLEALSRALLKVTVERVLQAEMDHHLGYKKHASEGRNSGNNRNGSSSKTVKGQSGGAWTSPHGCVCGFRTSVRQRRCGSAEALVQAQCQRFTALKPYLIERWQQAQGT